MMLSLLYLEVWARLNECISGVQRDTYIGYPGFLVPKVPNLMAMFKK
jgi:hypothetical protein